MLLQTKLYIPVTRGSLVPRPQLTERLNAGLAGRLTLVAAPAGFGKTTLIARWGTQLAASGERACAWLSLDEGDNEPATFCNYVIAALQTVDGNLGQSALELLSAERSDAMPIVLAALLNDIADSGRALLLVLDDYHLISNAAVHESIAFLLENAPPHLHLALISRADPPFPLARLRARQQITEIRQHALRFSQDEAERFLNELMALQLPESAVADLEKRTEGWVAGLQMAALSLQGQADLEQFLSDFSGSHRYIFDYLVEEALARRPAGTRQFLLQSSLLDRLCASLCDAVLQREGSQPILEQLESANLFLVPLDDQRRWYRYHHLFAELLQHHLRREQPERIPELHARASRWFEEAGYPEEAIKHALAAADYELAAGLVAQYSQSLVHRGELNRLLAWIDRLPVEWQRRHPQLIFNHAWTLLFRSGPREMDAALSHFPAEVANKLPYSALLFVLRGLAATRRGHSEKAIALAEIAEPLLEALEPSATNLSMRGVNAMVLASGYRTLDTARAEHLYQTAAALCRESGNHIVYWTAVRDRGTLLLEKGQLLQAEAVFLDGLRSEQHWGGKSGTQNKKLLAAAPIHVSLAALYTEWNRLDEAEAHLAGVLKLLKFIGPVNESEGLAAVAQLHLAQGNTEAVLPLLAQLEDLQGAANDQYARRRLAIAVGETACALYQQAPTPALRLRLERSLSALGDEPRAVLARARVLRALARTAQALSLLETFTKQMQDQGRHGLWLSGTILQCLAHQHLGETTEAIDGLRQALPVAESLGYQRLFLDMGQPMAELLQTAVDEKIQSGYATRLLARLPEADAAIPSPAPSGFESLSPREADVLKLIARGLTNKEIADTLVIAPSTAKRHTANIYNKLGVGNRAEATAWAYEMGFIE